MSIIKPNKCDIELPKGWKYEQISNGIYSIMKYCRGKRERYPTWLTSPNFEDLPRVKFDILAIDETHMVETIDSKHSFGEVAIWLIEMCEGEWRPVTDISFYIKDRDERIMFKIVWG